MNYRFTWDTEPTDEQLAVIMEEVAERVRKESAEIPRIIRENLDAELARARAQFAIYLKERATDRAFQTTGAIADAV